MSDPGTPPQHPPHPLPLFCRLTGLVLRTGPGGTVRPEQRVPLQSPLSSSLFNPRLAKPSQFQRKKQSDPCASFLYLNIGYSLKEPSLAVCRL